MVLFFIFFMRFNLLTHSNNLLCRLFTSDSFMLNMRFLKLFFLWFWRFMHKFQIFSYIGVFFASNCSFIGFNIASSLKVTSLHRINNNKIIVVIKFFFPYITRILKFEPKDLMTTFNYKAFIVTKYSHCISSLLKVEF